MRVMLDNSRGSRIAAGVKAVALIVLLGLIAVVTEPVLRSGAVIDEAQVLATPAPAEPANATQ